MSRKKGQVEYGEEAEKIIFSLISYEWQFTKDIQIRAQKKLPGIHFNTVLRILKKLKHDGRIRGKKIGRLGIWYH